MQGVQTYEQPPCPDLDMPCPGAGLDASSAHLWRHIEGGPHQRVERAAWPVVLRQACGRGCRWMGRCVSEVQRRHWTCLSRTAGRLQAMPANRLPGQPGQPGAPKSTALMRAASVSSLSMKFSCELSKERRGGGQEARREGGAACASQRAPTALCPPPLPSSCPAAAACCSRTVPRGTYRLDVSVHDAQRVRVAHHLRHHAQKVGGCVARGAGLARCQGEMQPAARQAGRGAGMRRRPGADAGALMLPATSAASSRSSVRPLPLPSPPSACPAVCVANRPHPPAPSARRAPRCARTARRPRTAPARCALQGAGETGGKPGWAAGAARWSGQLGAAGGGACRSPRWHPYSDASRPAAKPPARPRTCFRVLVRLQQGRHVGVAGQQRQDLHLSPQVLQVHPPPQLALAAPSGGTARICVPLKNNLDGGRSRSEGRVGDRTQQAVPPRRASCCTLCGQAWLLWCQLQRALLGPCSMERRRRRRRRQQQRLHAPDRLHCVSQARALVHSQPHHAERACGRAGARHCRQQGCDDARITTNKCSDDSCNSSGTLTRNTPCCSSTHLGPGPRRLSSPGRCRGARAPARGWCRAAASCRCRAWACAARRAPTVRRAAAAGWAHPAAGPPARARRPRPAAPARRSAPAAGWTGSPACRRGAASAAPLLPPTATRPLLQAAAAAGVEPQRSAPRSRAFPASDDHGVLVDRPRRARDAPASGRRCPAKACSERFGLLGS